MSLVLLLGLLLATACGDDSEAPLAILDITQGRAEIKTLGAADFVAGSDGEDLAAGDAVRVPEGSRAAVVFFEGLAVILEKGVELTIQRLTGSAESGVSNIELFQLAGRTFHRVNKLVDAESSYVMRTSSALGVVRGTGFIVQDDPVEGTKWKSFEGRVGVAGASRIEIVVEAGQSTEVPPAADPSPPIDDPIECDEQVVVEELDEVIIENEAKPPNRKDPDVTTPTAGPTPTLPPLEPPPPPQPPQPPASGTSPPAAPARTVAPTPSPRPAPPTLTPIAADREIATPARAPTDAATVAPTATPTRVRVPTATPIPSPAAAPRRVSPSDTPPGGLTEDGFEGPGGCASEEECRAFCQDPANAEECQAVAEAERLESDQKPLAGPGGCASEAECQAYCQDPANREECEAFATSRGIEIDRPEGQTGPGGCSSEAECQAYCQDPAHREECEAFATSMGIEIEHPKERTGPGGCRNQAECEAFCSVEENRATCEAFPHE